MRPHPSLSTRSLFQRPTTTESTNNNILTKYIFLTEEQQQIILSSLPENATLDCTLKSVRCVSVRAGFININAKYMRENAIVTDSPVNQPAKIRA